MACVYPALAYCLLTECDCVLQLKCEQYWPDKETEEKMYGDIGVTLTSVERTVDFVVRSFELRKADVVRRTKQFHYTTWPDHGVPIRASPIIAFRRRVRSYDESHPGIIVVHCRLPISIVLTTSLTEC